MYNVCQIFRDSLVSDFLQEVAFFLDAKVEFKEEEGLSFYPTIRHLAASPTMKKLVERSSDDQGLRLTLQRELSDLIARLETVAGSKGAKLWWSPLSRRHALRRSLTELMTSLKEAWKDVLIEALILKKQRELEDKVKDYIKRKQSTGSVSDRTSWREALYEFHSPGNGDRYRCGKEVAVQVRRSVELVPSSGKNISSKGKVDPVLMDSKVFSRIRSSFLARQQAADRLAEDVRAARAVLGN
jgi:hypothetical protein